MKYIVAMILTGLSFGLGSNFWTADSAMQTVAIQAMPAEGRLTSEFGFRKHPIRRGHCMHAGIDIANEMGTDIESTGEGVVVRVERDRGYGLMVEIDHGRGWTTRYAHLSESMVSAGDKVTAGTLIGKMGRSGSATGTHLHFEVRRYSFAVNPMAYLSALQVNYASNR